MRSNKILILYGNYGDGHQQAAKAIYDSLTDMHSNMEGILMDFMELTHPYIHPLSRYCYLKGVKNFPSAYGFLFSKSRDMNSFSSLLKKLNGFGLGPLLKYIQDTQPSMVVSTFPFAAAAISRLKEYGFIDVPTATVITDHTDHSSWVNPYTDQYIVGSEFVKQGLIRQDTPGNQISITGIPIRKEFNQSYNRKLLFQKYGLDPSLPTLLFMGGGCGFFEDGPSLVKSLEALPKRVQLLMVCGRNYRLARELKRMSTHSRHRLHIMGYTEFVPELMTVADLMVTKPGGLTVSEALAMNLPMLLYKPIPGQEQDNARYLLQAGVALQADNLANLVEEISAVLESPETLTTMREHAKKAQKKESAKEAIEVIVKTRREYITQGRTEQLVPSLQIL
jgi:processive 1,2-diacylglycerol beta-glucosyltransferase